MDEYKDRELTSSCPAKKDAMKVAMKMARKLNILEEDKISSGRVSAGGSRSLTGSASCQTSS